VATVSYESHCGPTQGPTTVQWPVVGWTALCEQGFVEISLQYPLDVELFLAEWLRLERLVRDVAGPTKEYVPLYRMLGNLRLVDPDMRFELNQLRRIRNQLVHGIEVLSLGQLRAATERLSALISEIEHRHGRE
jgi:hypothetical protein